jgi:hypothetical protein
MKALVVGAGEVLQGDKSKKSGKPYHFQMVHLQFKKVGVDGLAVKEQFVSYLDFPNLNPPIKVNDNLLLDYDDSGNLLEVEVIPAPTNKPQGFPPSK